MGAALWPVNFFDEVSTLTVRPSAPSAFPLANLQSDLRDYTWRSPNLDVQVIRFNWGGNARRISAWGIWPGHEKACLIGANVRTRFFPDAAWASAAVYDPGTLPFFPYTGQGWEVFPLGGHPWGVEHGDRTARLAPLVRHISAVTAGSGEIVISNAGAVDTPYFEAARIWVADYEALPWTARYGAEAGGGGSGEQWRNPYSGALHKLVGATWDERRYETLFESESDRAKWHSLVHTLDLSREIVFSLFPGELSRRERDHTVRGSLKVMNPLVWQQPITHALQLAITGS